MKIKVCDRCHKEIRWDLTLTDDDFKNDEAWRYMITKYCHPYPERIEIDLCLNCKKELAKWLRGK